MQAKVSGQPPQPRSRINSPDLVTVKANRRRVTSFAVWQTLLTEADTFDGRVVPDRVRMIREALRPARTVTDSQVAHAYEIASAEIEHAWHLGVPVDNRRRLRRIFDLLYVPATAVDADSLLMRLQSTHSAAGLRLLPGAIDALHAAAACSTVVLISDSWMTPGSALWAFLGRAGATRHVAAAYFSDITGQSKIGGGAFKAAWRSLNADPVACVHIGDLMEPDVVGSLKAGVGTAVWCPFDGDPVASWPVVPQREFVQVASLLDVPDLLTSIYSG